MALDKIAKDLGEVIENLKVLEKRKKELRPKFLALINEEQDFDQILPTRSIAVPKNFFDVTGMTEWEFVESRFPAWRVQWREERDNEIIFILERDSYFMGNTYRAGDIDVTTSVSETTPELDFDTLKLEFPDIFDEIVREVITYEVDDDSLNKLIDRRPEVMHYLTRHLKSKSPTLRVSAKRVKE